VGLTIAAWKYELVPSAWGDITVVWHGGLSGTRELINEVVLPGGKTAGAEELSRRYPGLVRGTSAFVRGFCNDLGRALEGEAVRFSLADLDMARCPDFTWRVLTACFRIPRGTVLSYGELAVCVGSPRGARAVGQVMAANPFPIIIPCHRVIRSDGSLGGYGGGLAMKKALLAMETM
jgi:methylated-DNA-[protein]-cysteine S-methyltransferase